MWICKRSMQINSSLFILFLLLRLKYCLNNNNKKNRELLICIDHLQINICIYLKSTVLLCYNKHTASLFSYEMEKKMNISYSRPSYSAFYPKQGGPVNLLNHPLHPIMTPNPNLDLPHVPRLRNHGRWRACGPWCPSRPGCRRPYPCSRPWAPPGICTIQVRGAVLSTRYIYI